MRRCGRRYATEADARRAADRRRERDAGAYEPHKCPGCRGWHLRAGQPAAAPARRAVRDTGPDGRARAIVWERDGGRCQACGVILRAGAWWSIQHRVARGQLGSNDLPNLVVLCGSATSPGCHRRAEDRAADMRERGFWLPSVTGGLPTDPAAVPIVRWDGQRVWLAGDGTVSLAGPAGLATSPPGGSS